MGFWGLFDDNDQDALQQQRQQEEQQRLRLEEETRLRYEEEQRHHREEEELKLRNEEEEKVRLEEEEKRRQREHLKWLRRKESLHQAKLFSQQQNQNSGSYKQKPEWMSQQQDSGHDSFTPPSMPRSNGPMLVSNRHAANPNMDIGTQMKQAQLEAQKKAIEELIHAPSDYTLGEESGDRLKRQI